MWPVNPNLPSQTCTQQDIAAVTPSSRLDNFVRPVRRRRKCRRSMHTWTQLFPEPSPCLGITAVSRRLETAILSLEPPPKNPAPASLYHLSTTVYAKCYPPKSPVLNVDFHVYRSCDIFSVNGLWHLHFFSSLNTHFSNKNQDDATKAARRASSPTAKR
ncbi:unnamed protein product, partial [Ectocarpus sp. 6 AP-2014]